MGNFTTSNIIVLVVCLLVWVGYAGLLTYAVRNEDEETDDE